MSKQNYVGQYLINSVGLPDLCSQEFGECIWQDSKNLICALYANRANDEQFYSIVLIPVRLAKKIKWYASFDKYCDDLFPDLDEPAEMTMTSKERDEFQSIRELPLDYSDDLGCRRIYPETNCVAQLARCIKVRPAAGKFLAKCITAEAAKQKARTATIEAIAKMIADAGLSAEEVAGLGSVTQTNKALDEVPF